MIEWRQKLRCAVEKAMASESREDDIVGGGDADIVMESTLRRLPFHSYHNQARNLLQNIEHTSRRIPGTEEVRRVMRFDIQDYRIRYGVPIFVTFSPDEAHNMLKIRLLRTRRNDPIYIDGRERFLGFFGPHG
jgi:hypothetical protein